MSTMLYMLAIIGGWNLINFIARCYYGQTSYQYSWSIVVGVWAVIAFCTGGVTA